MHNELVYIPESPQKQKQLVLKVKKLKAETDNLEDKYIDKMNMLDELKKSILQKAFSGELTAKDAA